MIVKKVPRKQKRPSNRIVRAHAAKLAKYIINAREEDARALTQFEEDSYARDLGHYAMGEEKVLATKSQNFRSEQLPDQLAEMDELIAQAGSNKDSVDHYVISWDESDKPTNDEIFDAVDILQQCQGTQSCCSIASIHGNTKHLHAHLAVLRIDPTTGAEIARPHNGFDIDGAHRALAVIADRYPSWKVTPNHRYEVRGGRMVHCTTAADVGQANDPTTWVPLVRASNAQPNVLSKNLLSKIEYQSLLSEEDTGFKSRKRIFVEEAVPILLAAKDWSDAHNKLAAIGIGLELAKNKSGANLVIDGKNVKASTYDGTALAKLVKRFNAPFQPRPGHVQIASFKPRPMFPNDPDRARYFDAKNAFTAELKQMRAEVGPFDQGYKSSVPSESCDPTKLLRKAFPSYEEWIAGGKAPEPAAILAQAGKVQGFAVDYPSRAEPRDIAGYRSQLTDTGVAYYKNGDPYSRPALFDVGRRIYVNDNDDASIVAALRLMSERSSGYPVRPFGPPAFLAQVQRIAAAEGIPIEIAPPREAMAAGSQHVPMPAPGREEASAPQNKASVPAVAPVIPWFTPSVSPVTPAFPTVARNVSAVPPVRSTVAPVVFGNASTEPTPDRQDVAIVASPPAIAKLDAVSPPKKASLAISPVEPLMSAFRTANTDEERRKAAAVIRSTPMALAEMNAAGGERWKSEQRMFADLQRARQSSQQGRGF